MDRLKKLWNEEPARLLGWGATILVLFAQQLLAQDIVSSDGAVKWLNLIITFVPAVVAELTRTQVSPSP